MVYKIGICGASGRTGSEIASLLSQGYSLGSDFFELADAISGSKKLTSVEGIDLRQIEDPAREPVHAWIDFSRREATLRLLENIDTPIVIGTTGFTVSELEKISRYAQKYPVLLTSNTSPGMNAMAAFLEAFPPAETFPGETILFEEHHRHKKDAPSGTAKMLLDILSQRDRKEVQVHVTRAGNISGVHSVKFVNEDEEVEIIHRVSHRRVFARGALLAARFILKQREPRVYAMREVFLEDK